MDNDNIFQTNDSIFFYNNYSSVWNNWNNNNQIYDMLNINRRESRYYPALPSGRENTLRSPFVLRTTIEGYYKDRLESLSGETFERLIDKGLMEGPCGDMLQKFICAYKTLLEQECNDDVDKFMATLLKVSTIKRKMKKINFCANDKTTDLLFIKVVLDIYNDFYRKKSTMITPKVS
jgi:hypothetical protein